ncbi:unnamed protein product [Cylindrotheca closterium]|uniref:NADH:ubiquinone oxidoreductase intermediate-associated protein 30 domain-containing protein n=1 Tax=Cylindrotheca closterium TaxID=2856 RepID=A0AAD2JIM4_9STRA|nr:unnamed protein product [Cylindrotheca closterium]
MSNNSISDVDEKSDANAMSGKKILLEDFSNPTNKWTVMNDPVMGGESYSSLEITEDGIAKFTGKCAIVPKLSAPGFITMETGSQFYQKPAKFADISTCEGFEFEIKTNTEYNGYRVSFGKAHVKGGRFAYGYKAPLALEDMPAVGEFGTVMIPFKKFSDKWNDATGDITVECSDDPSYCPSEQWLKRMETMSFWGEGIEGMVDLEVKTISAFGCDASATGIAEEPPMLQSEIHTIGSNPFYLGFTMMITLLLVCVLSCVCCCYHRRRAQTQRYNKAVDQLGDMTLEGAVYRDDDFEDQFEDENDLELS